MEKSYPKFTHHQAITFWNAITEDERNNINLLLAKMGRGEIKLKEVNVDKKNRIQNVVLEDRDRPAISAKPFYKHFSNG